MRQLLLAITLIAGLFVASVAEAQNIGVPQDKSPSNASSGFNVFAPSAPPSATTTTPAKPAASASTTTTPLPQLSTPAPSTPIPQTTVSRSTDPTAAAMASTYLPPTQQDMYIKMEKQNLASLQDGMASVMQLQANATSSAQSPQTKAFASMMNISPAQMQSSNQQAQNSLGNGMNALNAQLQLSQNRLAILQAGPIRMSDFAKLYGSGM